MKKVKCKAIKPQWYLYVLYCIDFILPVVGEVYTVLDEQMCACGEHRNYFFIECGNNAYDERYFDTIEDQPEEITEEEKELIIV